MKSSKYFNRSVLKIECNGGGGSSHFHISPIKRLEVYVKQE